MKNIIIYGASGHSKMIIDIIQKTKSHNVIGFLDSYKAEGEIIYGHKVLGSLEKLPKLIQSENITGIVIGIGDNYTRKISFDKIVKIAPHIEFVSVVHPSAVLAEDIEVSGGTVIMAGVIVNANARIGKFSILNTKSSLGHDSIMHDFSSLASGATVGGNVSIGECSAICLGSSIINNVSIGNHTVIGSGALVVNSIGDFKQAVGVPAHKVKDRAIDSEYLDRK
jgi:sugar O-acyltransferase (sialic acid O-acetyltransferase NeuD family)